MPQRGKDVPATLNSIFEKLGETNAIAREAKHAAAGASQKIDAVAGKVDALALVVTTQGQLREIVDQLKQTVKDQGGEIEILNTDKHRREGAMGLVAFVSRNWPFAFFTVIMGLIVAWANGKLPG